MEDFWLDKTKSDNRLFRFLIRHDLKWIFLHERPLAPEAAVQPGSLFLQSDNSKRQKGHAGKEQRDVCSLPGPFPYVRCLQHSARIFSRHNRAARRSKLKMHSAPVRRKSRGELKCEKNEH